LAVVVGLVVVGSAVVVGLVVGSGVVVVGSVVVVGFVVGSGVVVISLSFFPVGPLFSKF
jgi:hypothetical protein